jgi:hypothetical protein
MFQYTVSAKAHSLTYNILVHFSSSKPSSSFNTSAFLKTVKKKWNWTYNKIAFVIAKEINTYWSYIVRISIFINLASNILLLAGKTYFLTSQGLVKAGMNCRALLWHIILIPR